MRVGSDENLARVCVNCIHSISNLEGVQNPRFMEKVRADQIIDSVIPFILKTTIRSEGIKKNAVLCTHSE